MRTPALSPNTSLQIHLFGTVQVHILGVPMSPLRTRTGYWLLALLVLRNRPVPRLVLASQLWPDSDSSSALANLRRTLTDLRAALGKEAYRIHSPIENTLCLDLTGARVDLLDFDAACRKDDPQALEEALTLYCGPLLSECPLEWVLSERQDREDRHLRARQHLAERAMGAGDSETAIMHLQTVLKIDPLQEAALRSIMQAYLHRGEYETAMALYRGFAARLRRSEGMSPEIQTAALFQKVQAAEREQKRQRHTASPVLPLLESIPRFLPASTIQLRGREETIWEILAHLDACRLVTLVGSGGVGKTQLALQTGREVLPSCPDGVWFVDLSAVQDAARVFSEIADILSVREEEGQSPKSALFTYLYPRHLLLILDNCEHLLPEVGPTVDALLRASPHLRLLATSRQPLGVVGENVWKVPSLPMPLSPDSAGVPEEGMSEEALCVLQTNPAVQVFVDRAIQARHDFLLSPANATPIIRLCRRLDGIPLALELAAAWVSCLSVSQIAERLDHCFALLNHPRRTVLPRHQTLQATLDWSYGLLTQEERILLGALCIFAGGWTLEAAEAVCAEVLEHREVLPTLAQLVDKSLVLHEEAEGIGRYRMLATLREYAEQKRELPPIQPDLGERHLEFFVEWAQTAEVGLGGSEQAPWLTRVEREKDNVRAALARAVKEEEAHKGLRLASALWRFWYIRGHYQEGQEWLTQLLAIGTETADLLRLKAQGAAGNFALQRGEHTAAKSLFQRNLHLAEALGHQRAMSSALGNLGNVASEEGNYGEANAYFARSLEISRERGDSRGIALTLGNLGVVACCQEEYTLAAEYHTKSIALLREIGDPLNLAMAWNNLADVMLERGQEDEAAHVLAMSLPLCRNIHSTRGLLHGLLLSCSLAVRREQRERAAVLLGMCETLRATLSVRLPVRMEEAHERNLSQVRRCLNEEVFTAAVTQGRTLNSEQAVRMALEV